MRQLAQRLRIQVGMMLAMVFAPAVVQAGAGPTTLPTARFQDLPVASVTVDLGVNQEVRPQYSVFQMLQRMGDRRAPAESDAKDLRVLASRAKDSMSLMVVNFAIPRSQDRIATIHLSGLEPGGRVLNVRRIDRQHSWSFEEFDLIPVETREVDVREAFSFQVYSPADSVALVELRRTSN